MPSVPDRHPTPTSSHLVPNPHIRPVLGRLLIGRLVVLLILVCVSFAQETTVDSIDLAHLRARAEAGHAPEQIKLARALRSGIGVKQNPVEAVHWFLKAADQGDPEAQTEDWIAQHPFSPEEFAGYLSADLEKLFPEKFAHKP